MRGACELGGVEGWGAGGAITGSLMLLSLGKKVACFTGAWAWGPGLYDVDRPNAMICVVFHATRAHPAHLNAGRGGLGTIRALGYTDDFAPRLTAWAYKPASGSARGSPLPAL